MEKLVELRKRLNVSTNTLVAYEVLMNKYGHDYSPELLVELDLGYRQEKRKNENLQKAYNTALEEYEYENIT